ncbi:MAG: ABC transporter permease [Treponema sp.]|jgi:ABC-type nitrate/sulfonate/bicarbonate transport system permease component|nr:ABC transporter permease [Treponema sp.]
MKKSQNIFKRQSWLPFIPIAAVLLLWQVLSVSGIIPPYMLPGPLRVTAAFAADFPLLMRHLLYTLLEAFTGLTLAVTAAFVLAVFMDANSLIKQSVTPILLLTQTMPVIAVAPLLILWMGYGIAPKITLVFLTCFFPVTIALLGAFASADNDALRLLQSMGAKKWQLYRYIKIPQGLPAFFSGLKIAGSYSIIGAVIAEWLGGDAGLGVYMIRVRRSYSFDKMFAVIILVSALSLILIKFVALVEKAALPYRRGTSENHN